MPDNISDFGDDVTAASKDPQVRKAVSRPNVTNVVNAVESPAFQELAAGLPTAIKEAKAGYKTTEFWIALIGILGTQIGALDLPGEHGKTITTVALAVAYVLSRGVAKAGVPNIGMGA